jgi:integrase
VPDLALRVTPSGVKRWTVRYRHRGRLRRLTLGDVAVVSLADARARARDALGDAGKGEDPAAGKQAGRKAETLGELADLYLTKWAKPRKRGGKADDNLLRRRLTAVAQPRDRVLTEDEIRSLWTSFNALDPPMAAFYKLRLLTVQRGGEVAAMRWSDVDLDAGWWTIPATHSKNRLAHRVPLHAAALDILRALRTRQMRTPSAFSPPIIT